MGLRSDFRGHALQQRDHLLQLLLRLGEFLARRCQFGSQSPRSVLHDRLDSVDRVVDAVRVVRIVVFQVIERLRAKKN